MEREEGKKRGNEYKGKSGTIKKKERNGRGKMVGKET